MPRFRILADFAFTKVWEFDAEDEEDANRKFMNGGWDDPPIDEDVPQMDDEWEIDEIDENGNTEFERRNGLWDNNKGDD